MSGSVWWFLHAHYHLEYLGFGHTFCWCRIYLLIASWPSRWQVLSWPNGVWLKSAEVNRWGFFLHLFATFWSCKAWRIQTCRNCGALVSRCPYSFAQQFFCRLPVNKFLWCSSFTRMFLNLPEATRIVHLWIFLAIPVSNDVQKLSCLIALKTVWKGCWFGRLWVMMMFDVMFVDQATLLGHSYSDGSPGGSRNRTSPVLGSTVFSSAVAVECGVQMLAKLRIELFSFFLHL